MQHMPQCLHDINNVSSATKHQIMLTCSTKESGLFVDVSVDNTYDSLNINIKTLYENIASIFDANINAELIINVCWYLRQNNDASQFWFQLNGYNIDNENSGTIWLISPTTVCTECETTLNIKFCRDTEIVSCNGIIDAIDITLQCSNIN